MKPITQYKVVRLFPEPHLGRCVETEQIEQELNNNAKERWELFSMEERSAGNFPEVVSVTLVLSRKALL